MSTEKQRYIMDNKLSLLGFLPEHFDNTNDVIISNHSGSDFDEEGDMYFYAFTSSRTLTLQDFVVHT